MKKKIILLDKYLIEADAALLESLTPGILPAKGVFETMRAYQGKIFALEQHLKRLFRGLKWYRIKGAPSRKKIKKYIEQVMSANHLKDARVRLTVWKDHKRSRMSIICLPLPAVSESVYKRGYKAQLSKVRIKRTWDSHIKSLNYGDLRRAYLLAQRRGYDETILLNSHHHIVEGARTNLFYVKRGIIYTPGIACGCLNGITRQIVIQCARALSLPCKATKARVKKLSSADEAFLTNSLLGVMPLTALGRKRIAAGKPGPITLKILKAYRALVKKSLL